MGCPVTGPAAKWSTGDDEDHASEPALSVQIELLGQDSLVCE
jgi:hypothetical protein